MPPAIFAREINVGKRDLFVSLYFTWNHDFEDLASTDEQIRRREI